MKRISNLGSLFKIYVSLATFGTNLQYYFTVIYVHHEIINNPLEKFNRQIKFVGQSFTFIKYVCYEYLC